MNNFDTDRYLGRWYEFARSDLPWENNCATATAFYSLDAETNNLEINNSCYDELGNLIDERSGIAMPKKQGYFIVEFNDGRPAGPPAPYIVLQTDYKSYALVTSGKYSWILSRTASNDKFFVHYMANLCRKYNINTKELFIGKGRLKR